jgi:hypothetical protein
MSGGERLKVGADRDFNDVDGVDVVTGAPLM